MADVITSRTDPRQPDCLAPMRVMTVPVEQLPVDHCTLYFLVLVITCHVLPDTVPFARVILSDYYVCAFLTSCIPVLSSLYFVPSYNNRC